MLEGELPQDEVGDAGGQEAALGGVGGEVDECDISRNRIIGFQISGIDSRFLEWSPILNPSITKINCDCLNSFWNQTRIKNRKRG